MRDEIEPTGMKEEDDYQAADDLRTLGRAHAVMADKKRHLRAKKMGAKHAALLKKITAGKGFLAKTS